LHTDQEILRLLQNGQETAIDILFREHYTYLCQAVMRILPNSGVAEDLVQEVFLELWRKRQDISVQISFRAYLRRAAVNKALNYLRDRRLLVEDEESMPFSLAADTPLADEQLEADELKAEIDRAIAALPERCRQVFVLSRFEERSAKEIAELLDISTKTVENQMTKALRTLREWLGPLLGREE
jgi:RNA polymerase sigma-70 factor (ECF subfamily)